MLKGFRDFLLRGNVVDLAVAVVIGAAFSSIVNSLVKNIITPLIGSIGGEPDFSKVTFTINHSKFFVGEFFNAVISFLIISSVIYFFVVLPMNRILAKIKKSDSDKTCPHCMSLIPSKATRCKFCTSVVK